MRLYDAVQGALECTEKYSNVPVSLSIKSIAQCHPSHETVLDNASIPKVTSFGQLVQIMLDGQAARLKDNSSFSSANDAAAYIGLRGVNAEGKIKSKTAKVRTVKPKSKGNVKKK